MSNVRPSPFNPTIQPHGPVQDPAIPDARTLDIPQLELRSLRAKPGSSEATVPPADPAGAVPSVVPDKA